MVTRSLPLPVRTSMTSMTSMRFDMRFKLLTILFIVLCATAAHANITLPDVISSAMVLQRDQRVPIWGKADPGESVTVTFGQQTRTAVADASGNWIIRLGPM